MEQHKIEAQKLFEDPPHLKEDIEARFKELELQGEMVIKSKNGRNQLIIGRNSLCPCGSKKKFKKCHGANV